MKWLSATTVCALIAMTACGNGAAPSTASEKSAAGRQIELPADRTNYAALADAHDLKLVHDGFLVGPVFTGHPVYSAREKGFGLLRDEAAKVSGLMDLIALGLDPSIIERNAVCWAMAQLPEEERSAFVVGSPKTPRNARWVGSNEFEIKRNEEAFLSQHADAIRARAVELPVTVVFVKQARLLAYDEARGGFPLSLLSGSNQNSFAAWAGYQAIADLGQCAEIDASTPTVKLPDFLPIAPGPGEQLANSVGNERTAYILVRTRLYPVDSASVPEQQNSGSPVWPMWSRLDSIELYTDPELTSLVHRYDLDRGPVPGIVAATTSEPVLLSVDRYGSAVLMARFHDGPAPEAVWPILLDEQFERDQKTYRSDKEEQPFFPNGFRRLQAYSYTDGVAERFREWLSARSKQPLQVLLNLQAKGESEDVVVLLAGGDLTALHGEETDSKKFILPQFSRPESIGFERSLWDITMLELDNAPHLPTFARSEWDEFKSPSAQLLIEIKNVKVTAEEGRPTLEIRARPLEWRVREETGIVRHQPL